MSQQSGAPAIGVVFVGVLVLCGAIAFGMWGCPTYGVWTAEMKGRAAQSKAEFERQTIVIEAEAKKTAEITRAEGVAKANTIIADSLKGNDAYLRYLWIQTLKEDNKTVVYIPTEANLPILEATRLTEPKTPDKAEK